MADYRKVVTQSVRRAFKQLGTLAENVVFNSSQPSAFDFSTATATSGAVTQLTLKAVVVESKKKADEEKPAITKTVIMKSEDVPSLDAYDTVVYGGNTWHVVRPIKDDGYLVYFDISRSV